HIWEDKLINRKNGRTCPFCSIHSVSIQKRYPELAKQWDFEKNGEMTPLNTPFGYGKAVWWKCSKGDDHVWKATPNSRTKQKSGCSTGCPICSGRKVVSSNCLANTNPKLALEWNHLLNKKLTPYQVTSGSGKKVWWKCPKGNDHIWEATVLNRSNGLGCPFCTLTPQSKQELIITFELKQFFDINPKGFKTRVDGKLWSIDIYVPEINLGIEFDGSYWHKGKSELDKLKTKKLHQEGFHIIRVRQEPLKRIFDNDVMVRKKFDGKVIVNDILKQILKEHSLDSKIISKINKYLALDSIQNEKALDKYIDMILEEKAERKKSK
ncbi:zinc-ribbon domain-containing protein, partial [Akkermansiaceae bacterium]|nr:zinc-ribbon domain-containing protein [Akkermansiaceae bacterium]